MADIPGDVMDMGLGSIDAYDGEENKEN